MNSQRIAVFPGSFDPFTKGHEAVVKKAMILFDEIIIAVGANSSKQNYFNLETRLNHLKALYKDNAKVKIETYEGLTVNFCQSRGAQFIVRGLRDGKDFEYEKSIAIMNHSIAEQVDTVFFMTDAEFSAINSVIIRDILRNGGDASKFLPEPINKLL